MPKSNSNPQKRKHRLGDLLVAHSLITSEQLQQALKVHNQEERQLGSILVQLGFISIENLLKFLGKQAGVPSANLFKMNIPQEVIQLISLERINSLKILPISQTKTTMTLAMVTPQDFMTISDLEFKMGKKIKPVIVPSFMMEAATKLLAFSYQDGLSGESIEKMTMESKTGTGKVPPLKSLIRYLVKSGASDMLLTAGAPPSIKLVNEVKRLASVVLTPEDCHNYAHELLTEDEKQKFLDQNDIDFAITYADIGRFRVNIYCQRNSISIAIRNLMEQIPTLEYLNVPEWVASYALKPSGLILICSPSAHGKSTTLCAMVDIINKNRRCNIVTLEDPVEYMFKHKKSNVNQRQVGRDTDSFAQGLRSIFRQAADVIVVGEMRDKETFEIALHAANTGHLVISTVHSDNSTAIIERIVNMFPAYEQNLIRGMLADSLLLSLSQRLVPNRNKTGRVMALEYLVNTYRIKNMIREGKTYQIRSQLQAGAEDYSSLDYDLAALFKSGQIEMEDGLLYAENEQLYREFCGKIIIKKPTKRGN